MSAQCPLGVDAADVAAWIVDHEPLPGVDLAAHVPACEACAAVGRAVAPAAGLGASLRSATHAQAAERVQRRVLDRVRLEATALLLVRTAGGAAARIAQALPTYLSGRRRQS